MSTVEKFQAAVDVIRGLPRQGSFQPSSDMQLKFYSFYKQATEGPCTNPKPNFWDIVGRAKWDAWKALGSMDQEEAMEKYVDELKEVVKVLKRDSDLHNSTNSNNKIVETMSYTESVSKFLALLGPFYESVPYDKDHATMKAENDAALGDSLLNPHLLTTKGEKKQNGPDNGHVNGFGDSSEHDSDGDEFSDTYDNIKEPLEEGDLLSLALGGGNGGGVDFEKFDDSELVGHKQESSLNGVVSFPLYDSAYSFLNSVHHKNENCFDDSPARHSHPAMSPSHNQSLSSQNHSFSQPILVQENENQIWAFPREGVLNAVKQLKGCNVDGIVQARGGADQNVGPVNTRNSNAGTGGGGLNPAGRGLRTRTARGDRSMGSGGDGDPGGSEGASGPYSDVSDQLALAVIKLQHSMDSVNTRLSSLETALQGRSTFNKTASRKDNWTLMGISPQLLFLILAWPFLAHWVIHIMRKRSQR